MKIFVRRKSFTFRKNDVKLLNFLYIMLPTTKKTFIIQEETINVVYFNAQ